ncbi:hypothetical protein OP10G_4343 [Fimbriimonas ginsengisoli Gsoil 348]|uniref:Uncharacterized protein n=2 Tax=Fimbriimonas ginsengisoli TaxID=1005039 RepID=A0A068NW86_FIMGI|nr:hypothetical protein OP10G_4343 [Fimbriimonas ginsengisoli Gsoil 348]
MAEHDATTNMAGIEAELDLAEMEIASGRFGEARLRFARMTRIQRETPRALVLRARATQTEESRRMLASFVRQALDRFKDPLSRALLAEALALCGDRAAAMKALPKEGDLNSNEISARQAALDAMGSVPDLPEESGLTLGALLQQKLLRRTS